MTPERAATVIIQNDVEIGGGTTIEHGDTSS
jgi:UDP-3-O-[3-hydroxymyristoyl] glucosamine N-acyltransferase